MKNNNLEATILKTIQAGLNDISKLRQELENQEKQRALEREAKRNSKIAEEMANTRRRRI